MLFYDDPETLHDINFDGDESLEINRCSIILFWGQKTLGSLFWGFRYSIVYSVLYKMDLYGCEVYPFNSIMKMI